MRSSPTTPALAQLPGRPDLLTVLGSVPDRRDPRGVRHTLPVILAVAVAAVLSGARSFAAIGDPLTDRGGPVRCALVRRDR
jgi:hypothetical protein